MNLTKEQKLGFNQIELRIVLQRAIELIDEIDANPTPIKNQKLKSQLKSVYGPLDKETKKYNDIFDASQDGTNAFYDITMANYLIVMRNCLVDKNVVSKALICHEIDMPLMDYTMNKIIKKHKEKQ